MTMNVIKIFSFHEMISSNSRCVNRTVLFKNLAYNDCKYLCVFNCRNKSVGLSGLTVSIVLITRWLRFTTIEFE